MIEILVVVFAILAMVYALGLVRMGMGREWLFSPLFLYVIVSIVFVNIGFVVFFLEHLGEVWATTALMSVSVGLLLVGFGGFVVASALRMPTVSLRTPASEIEIDIPYGIAVITGLVVFAVVMLYFYLLGYVPLFRGIRLLLSQGFVIGLVNTLRIGRDIYVNPEATYIPLQGFMETVRYNGLPIVAIWFYHFYRLRIKPFWSLVMLLNSGILIILTGQRWPIMNMLLTIMIFLQWTGSNPTSFFRIARQFGILGLLVGVIMTILLGRTAYPDAPNFLASTILGLRDLVTRIFLGASVPFASYQLFPVREGWLYGQSWIQNLLAYLPGPMPSYPVTFAQLVTGSRIGFTSPPDFYTEAYINFGWFGVVFVSLLWGSLVVLFQRQFLQASRMSLLRISVLALMSTLIVLSSATGVAFIIGGGVAVVFILVISGIQKTLFSRSRKPGLSR